MELRARFARGMRSLCLGAVTGLVLLPAALGPQPAAAQAFASFEFSLSNPGARSLGFGGAFVALADDATAAFANPAGLVQIARPEVSIEGRSWSYDTPYTRGGRAAGEPTGRGIDTVSVPLRGESSADLSGLSFFAYVYPHRRWSFAVFQHQLANFEFTLETQGVFGPGEVVAGSERTQIQRGRIDLEILTRGLAVAFRPIDSLSFGLGLSYFEPSTRLLGWDYLPDDDSVESYFSQASFLPERLVQVIDFTWSDPEWGVSAGFLWRLSESWTLGGLYRETPTLGLAADLVAGPAHPVFADGFKFIEGFRTAWDFPDVWALGLGYRSRDGRWTGSAEWRRVEYSSIIESLLPQQRSPGDFLDDADELRLGGEYAFFVGTSVMAVRAGVWHDPSHYLGSRSEDPFLGAILPPEQDELHFAAGFGAAFRRLQIDLGVDLSERIDTAALSVIYSFGG